MNDIIDESMNWLINFFGQEKWDRLVNEKMPREVIKYAVGKFAGQARPTPKSKRTADINELWWLFLGDAIKAMILIMRSSGSVTNSDKEYLNRLVERRKYVFEDGETLDQVIANMDLVPYSEKLLSYYLCFIIYNYGEMQPPEIRQDFFDRLNRFLFFAACGTDQLEDWDEHRIRAIPVERKDAVLLAVKLLGAGSEEYTEMERFLKGE